MNEQTSRKGEKLGWSVGWIGGYSWVVIMSIIFIYQGKIVEGLLGLVQFILWIGCVVYFAPWRHPNTMYLYLMLPLYVLFFISAGWLIWAFGGVSDFKGINLLEYFWFLPILIPIPILYKKKWNKHVVD
ncbi:MAG: hypothetical protein N3A62_05310 [Thermodesulfovibrionales bacterium]|nr:hypothetical protein [Thermodesulfovibrionales bacterium]